MKKKKVYEPSQWVEDPEGYFIISLDKDEKIIVEHYKKEN